MTVLHVLLGASFILAPAFSEAEPETGQPNALEAEDTSRSTVRYWRESASSSTNKNHTHKAQISCAGVNYTVNLDFLNAEGMVRGAHPAVDQNARSTVTVSRTHTQKDRYLHEIPLEAMAGLAQVSSYRLECRQSIDASQLAILVQGGQNKNAYQAILYFTPEGYAGRQLLPETVLHHNNNNQQKN